MSLNGKMKKYTDAGYGVDKGKNIHGHPVPPKGNAKFPAPSVLESACAGQREKMPRPLPVE